MHESKSQRSGFKHRKTPSQTCGLQQVIIFQSVSPRVKHCPNRCVTSRVAATAESWGVTPQRDFNHKFTKSTSQTWVQVKKVSQISAAKNLLTTPPSPPVTDLQFLTLNPALTSSPLLRRTGEHLRPTLQASTRSLPAHRSVTSTPKDHWLNTAASPTGISKFVQR